MQIQITMKSGSKMTIEAEGRCISNSYGSGEPFQEVEDLTCYWPGKGKAREISPSLYDVTEAEENFWEASASECGKLLD